MICSRTPVKSLDDILVCLEVGVSGGCDGVVITVVILGEVPERYCLCCVVLCWKAR